MYCVIGCYADSCICCLCVCSLVVIGWVCAWRLLGLTVNSIVVVICLYGFVCVFGFGFVFIVICDLLLRCVLGCLVYIGFATAGRFLG